MLGDVADSGGGYGITGPAWEQPEPQHAPARPGRAGAPRAAVGLLHGATAGDGGHPRFAGQSSSPARAPTPIGVSSKDSEAHSAQRQHAEQTEYFVLAYDTTTMQVVSFTGHGHDFVSAALALTRLVNEHRHHPQVQVRLEAAASLEELWRRDPVLFTRLRFPERGESDG